MAVKLWPVPTIFTVDPSRRAAVTASTTSSTEVGVATLRGSAGLEARPVLPLHATSLEPAGTRERPA